MITFTRAYQTSGGETFATLQEAQKAEMMAIIDAQEPHYKGQDYVRVIVGHIVEQADKVIDILSTKATSRPKARKLNGGTKKRKVINSEDVIAAAKL